LVLPIAKQTSHVTEKFWNNCPATASQRCSMARFKVINRSWILNAI